VVEARCIKCTLRRLPDMAAGRKTVHQMHPTAAAGYGSWPKHGASNAPYGCCRIWQLAEARCIKCTLRLPGRSTVHQMHPTAAAGYGGWPKNGASNAPYAGLLGKRTVHTMHPTSAVCTPDPAEAGTPDLLPDPADERSAYRPDMASGSRTVHSMHPTAAGRFAVFVHVAAFVVQTLSRLYWHHKKGTPTLLVSPSSSSFRFVASVVPLRCTRR
jgi:hypothetical protein